MTQETLLRLARKAAAKAAALHPGKLRRTLEAIADELLKIANEQKDGK